MKKNLKQLSALLLALSLSVSVTACGGSTATTATTAAETPLKPHLNLLPKHPRLPKLTRP